MNETAVKERPILMADDLVTATLAGRKTQTRRPVKPQPDGTFDGPSVYESAIEGPDGEMRDGPLVCGIYDPDGDWGIVCPFGKPGDRLWVREAWGAGWHDGRDGYTAIRPTGPQYDRPDKVFYRADGWDESEGRLPWRPSIHMPRWASRLSLEITNVRVERVQDISEVDAMLEGLPHCELCEPPNCGQWGRGAIDDPLANACGGRPWHNCQGDCEGMTAHDQFGKRWNSHYAKTPYAWAANPWVWVLDYKVVK